MFSELFKLYFEIYFNNILIIKEISNFNNFFKTRLHLLFIQNVLHVHIKFEKF